jgi:hypothetical protein
MVMDWKEISGDDREKRRRYERSREYFERKRPVIIRAGGMGGPCERCRKAPWELIHHLTYERLYCELPDDLQALCKPCADYVEGRSEFDPLRKRDRRRQKELPFDRCVPHSIGDLLRTIKPGQDRSNR